MTANYDAVAPFYDRLSYLVFGNAQRQAQVQQLRYIQNGADILICGGGSGRILEDINQCEVKGIKISFLDSSIEMIKIAKKRKCENISVEFIKTDILTFKDLGKYDIIITSFFFDNFSEAESEKVFQKLDLLLKPEGLWFFNDFTLQYGKGMWWKGIMLKVMYLFFKITSHLTNDKLVEMEIFFKINNYEIIDHQLFFKKFILSRVYKKNENFKDL